MALQDTPNIELTVGERLYGYVVEHIAPLPEINAVIYRLTHAAMGARHLHIQRPDSENTFGVTFKTIPIDSTGVAHILEHTVLCGSQRYPVRDPFFSMLKRSLSTFMNAFTASDWTMYPYATQNPTDYYNLMDVYLDAVFFPLITELSFKQEGHRLEFEADGTKPEGPVLVYKGVVYNEMKGAMSSADQVLARSLLNALYPDTTYSNNSGGDPAVIPQLSHEQLVAFHRRHYHPSNAYFYTYGNLPLKGHLRFIADKIMSKFTRIDPQTSVPSQPRWSSPRTARYTYPLASSEDPRRKSQAVLAWLAAEIHDTFEVLVLAVLEQILLGNSGSPLRKALMDSGLGSALSDGSGYDADNRDTFFNCGLKDIEEGSADALERMILDTIGRLAFEKIPPQAIHSAIHQIEFHRKEVTNSPYPYGIKLLMRVIGSWLHGGAPERILQLDADIFRLRQEIDQGPFLEGRLERYFLKNPHRVRLLLSPDQRKAAEEERRVRMELDGREENLNEPERQKIRDEARRLQQLQESQEDVGCLPTLGLTDIKPEVDIYTPSRTDEEIALWCYDQPTSGIFYFNGAASASELSADLLPWVPFFCHAFNKIGTRRYDYSVMAQRIDAETGGLKLADQARVVFDQTGSCLPMVTLNAKCLARNVPAMLTIVEELIAEADYRVLPRLQQLLGEYVAGLESMIVHNGHRLAISRSARNFSTATTLAEMWGGVEHIRTMRDFHRRLDQDRLTRLGETLALIAEQLFTPGNFVMSAIGESTAIQIAVDKIRGGQTLSRFRRRNPLPWLRPLSLPVKNGLPFEGWSTSSAVAFVAQTRITPSLGHPDAPILAVLSKMLRSLYLHREIREKGGAYGGFALYNPENGLLSMASYRDPHVVRTLNVYAGAADYLSAQRFTDEDIKEAVLQVCSEIDRPDPPGPSAHKAFGRLIVGLTDEARQKFKADLLDITRIKILETAEKYLGGKEKGTGVAVIAGQDQLSDANRQLGAKPLSLNVI